jgi:hypothetical protein
LGTSNGPGRDFQEKVTRALPSAPASRIRKSGEEILAGATGLEPAAFGVTGQQFNLNIQDAFQLFEAQK